MQLKAKGQPHLIQKPLIGKVSRKGLSGESYILIEDEHFNLENLSNCEAILSHQPWEDRVDFPSVYNIVSFDHLEDGDIVLVNTDGIVNTLYRINSSHNFLLITERCNSNCIMCSQPPRDRDDSYLMDIYEELIPMIPKTCVELGLTGGEPTLLGNQFFNLLSQLKVSLPDTEIHCLTNGRSFAWHSMADRLAELQYERLMLGIPLYSDSYEVHDYVVQANNAFNQTMKGLYNLALDNQRIEIRIVLHRQTIPRLEKLARFIYKNLPFVEHVAFMGLENQGYTPHNIDKLWIEPMTYMPQLTEAANFLYEMGMNVSIYNLQLCVLSKDLWKFNRKSISDWKNEYLPECHDCLMLDECGGFFDSNLLIRSKYIKPFKV